MEFGNYKIYKLDDISYAMDEHRTVMKGKKGEEKTLKKEWVRKGYYTTATSALCALADKVSGDNLNSVEECLGALSELRKHIEKQGYKKV